VRLKSATAGLGVGKTKGAATHQPAIDFNIEIQPFAAAARKFCSACEYCVKSDGFISPSENTP